MLYSFKKLNGLGNDFIFIEDANAEIEFTPAQVAELCDRHFGIGADGVILVRPATPQASECVGLMYYINSDGTLAEMCGNGVRCTAKYLVDHGYVPAGTKEINVETLSGPKHISYEVDDDGLLTLATVDMGTPGYAAEDPIVTIDSPWGAFTFYQVSMGNPHAVCFIDDWTTLPDACFTDAANKSLATLNVNGIGVFFATHPTFPEGSNIEFVQAEPDGLHMRVCERGCGETLACGTGSCATLVAAALAGKSPRENDVLLLGGTLHIVWNENDHVMMTGPAVERFEGEIEVL